MDKEFTLKAREKALKVTESINEKKIAEGSKATTVGILVDKARLIDGESTSNIAYADLTRELKDLEAEERALKARMGIED